jgi:hypothetical protein
MHGASDIKIITPLQTQIHYSFLFPFIIYTIFYSKIKPDTEIRKIY